MSKDKIDNFNKMLVKAKPKIELSLPKDSYFSADRLLQVMSSEFHKCPKLLDCSAASLGGAVMLAARLGLEPDSALGHFYILPYGKTAQVIIGYRGMLELALRSPLVKSLYAQEVYANDTFDIVLGSEKHIRHVPFLGESRGELVAVYAIATLECGEQEIEVMSRAEIDHIKKKSRSGGSGPWVSEYSSMARKSVLRRICKYIPRAIDLQRAASTEESLDVGSSDTKDFVDAEDFGTVDTETGEITPKEKCTVTDLKETLQG